VVALYIGRQGQFTECLKKIEYRLRKSQVIKLTLPTKALDDGVMHQQLATGLQRLAYPHLAQSLIARYRRNVGRRQQNLFEQDLRAAARVLNRLQPRFDYAGIVQNQQVTGVKNVLQICKGTMQRLAVSQLQ
jgi:hypothetical protein